MKNHDAQDLKDANAKKCCSVTDSEEPLNDERAILRRSMLIKSSKEHDGEDKCSPCDVDK